MTNKIIYAIVAFLGVVISAIGVLGWRIETTTQEMEENRLGGQIAEKPIYIERIISDILASDIDSNKADIIRELINLHGHTEIVESRMTFENKPVRLRALSPEKFSEHINVIVSSIHRIFKDAYTSNTTEDKLIEYESELSKLISDDFEFVEEIDGEIVKKYTLSNLLIELFSKRVFWGNSLIGQAAFGDVPSLDSVRTHEWRLPIIHANKESSRNQKNVGAVIAEVYPHEVDRGMYVLKIRRMTNQGGEKAL